MFGRRKKSSSVAKDRLQIVLIHDRANCSPEILEMMRNDIIDVINKYMVVDEFGIELDIKSTKSETGNRAVPALYANIPIKKMRNPNQR